jgi:hypothetical protein
MSPVEWSAFQEVSIQCRNDVERLCDDVTSFSSSPMDEMMSQLFGVPFFSQPSRRLDSSSWVSLAPPSSSGSFFLLTPDVSEPDFGRSLDRMLDTVLALPPPRPCPKMGAPQAQDTVTPEQEGALVSQLAAFTHPDHVDHVVQRVKNYGNDLLIKEDPPAETSRRLHVARRLSEVSPADIRALHIKLQHESSPRRFLPFGLPQRNQCLYRAYQSRRVSATCGNALALLDNVRAVQRANNLAAEAQTQSLLHQLSLITSLYALVCLIVMVLVVLRRKRAQDQRQLVRTILRAVYSRPTIKAAVAREMALAIKDDNYLQDPDGILGWVPPMLHRSSSDVVCEFARSMGLLTVTALMAVAVWMPAYLFVTCWSVLALALLGLFLHKGSCKESVEICTCCCCGVTTADVAAGLVSPEQACCNCCQGTGICSVACYACCFSGSDGCDQPCSDCCCPDDKPDVEQDEKEAWFLAEEKEECCSPKRHVTTNSGVAVYGGIPVQIV